MEAIGRYWEASGKFRRSDFVPENRFLQLVIKPSTAQIIYDIRYNLSKCLDLEQKTKKK